MTGINQNIVVDVTLGDPNADPKVTQVYFPSLQGAGLMGPTGHTGLRGPQGNRGPTGPIGLTGPYGLTGPEGFRGDVYGSEFAVSGGMQVPYLQATINLTIDQNLAYTPGQQAVVIAASTSGGGLTYDPNNKFFATVISYDSTTGEISLYCLERFVDGVKNPTYGGTIFTNWLANLRAASASQGDTGPTGPDGIIGSTGPIGIRGLTGVTGSIGDTGPTGPGGGAKGDDGPIGPTGSIGPIGITGDIGVTGPIGGVGPTGPTGNLGPIGPPWGPTGPTGAQGVQGAAGATGATGPQGITGPQGPQGLVGEPGSTGAQGPLGPQGLVGPIGAIGETGPTGPTGLHGPTGIIGPTGVQGEIGSTGPTGIIGVTGPTGDVGPSGGVGEKYSGISTSSFTIPSAAQTRTIRISSTPAGVALTDLAYSIGQRIKVVYDISNSFLADITNTAYTLSGSPQYIDLDVVCVSNSFVNANALNLWSIYLDGVIGHEGPTGPIGIIGPTGLIGPQGNIGFTGLMGPSGATGGIGATGSIGPTGPVGLLGPTGPTGPIPQETLIVNSAYPAIATTHFSPADKLNGALTASNYIQLTSAQPTIQTMRRGLAHLGKYFEVGTNNTFSNIVYDSRLKDTIDGNFIGKDLTLGSTYYIRVNGRSVPNHAFRFNQVSRPPSVIATVNTNANPYDLAYVPTLNKMYITTKGGVPKIEVLDLSNNTFGTAISTNVPGQIQGIIYCPSTDRLFVASVSTSTISVIDPSTNNIVATINVGNSPVRLVYCPSNDRIYVTNTASNKVSVIDPSVNEVVSEIQVGVGPRGIEYCPSNNRIYVVNYNEGSVNIINPISNKVIKTLSIGNLPVDIKYCPSNDIIYVTNFSPTSVYIIEAQTDNYTYFSGGLGSNPLNLGYNPNLDRVYVSNFGSNTVSLIDPRAAWHSNPSTSSTPVTSSLAVGTNPRNMAFSPINDKIYLVNQSTNNISIIE
jgi:YVTN family beta-propeller protein